MNNQTLVAMIKDGADKDGNLMLELYENNIGLLYSTARKIGVPFEYMEDLTQEYFLFLSDAVSNYDSGNGTPFISYFAECLRFYLITFMNKQSGLPIYRQENIRLYKKAKRQYEQILQREPTQAELSKFIGVSVKKIKEIEADIKSINVVSLSEITPAGTEILELIPDLNNPIEEIEDRLDLETRNKEVWALVLSETKLTKETIVKYLSGEISENIKPIRTELYKAIRHVRNKRNRLNRLRQLCDYDFYNLYRSKSVNAFQNTNSSIVEDLVFKKLESEEKISC